MSISLDQTTKFLLAVVVVMAATHGLGRLARRCGQPSVVGEIAAGIALGPSLLGALAPAQWRFLFPPGVLTALDLAAQLGLVAFMFLIGWEVDLGGLRRQGRTVLTVSVGGLVVPLLAGAALGPALYRTYRTGTVGPGPFTLFLGLALAVTAVPVLARILDDTGLTRTRVGGLALASAVLEDVAAWTLLAVTLALASVSAGLPAPLILAAAAGFAAAMFLLVRPLLARMVRVSAEHTVLPLALGGALAAAVVTQVIGIHAIFGAFLFGLVMPRHTPVVEVVTTRIRAFTMSVLLPLFFAVVGMRTTVGALGPHLGAWVAPLVVLAVAMVSKLVGAGLAARLSGSSWSDSYVLGVLMNCRGLTELVIASIGLQFHLIDQRLFTVLVLVALATTALTTPLLRLRPRTPAPASQVAAAALAER